MTNSQLRSNRRRSAKTPRFYHEPDTDLEYDVTPSVRTSRPTRSSRRVQTYRERSSSEDETSTLSSESEPRSTSTSSARPGRAAIRKNTRLANGRKSRYTRGSKRNQSALSASFASSGYKKQKVNPPHRPDRKIQNDANDDVGEIRINLNAPPWQSLEYHILLKIMQYAAYPLYTSTFRSRTSIEWLVGVSRLCKCFHEAAMATLLWEPPLLPISRAYRMLSIFSQDQERTMLNYTTKVRSLNIEVKHLLVKKSGIEINDLLSCTPLLTHLRIFHWHDEMVGKAIWAEPIVAHFKWSYGRLFECLDDNGVRLKSFEWSGRFQDTLDVIDVAHLRPSMVDLEELTIVNFTYTEKQDHERINCRDRILSALSTLQRLRKLEFRNCTILDMAAMTQLPVGLTDLKIVNCLSLTSESIISYLTIGGKSIRTLHLEGNQVMDLAFMPRLSEFCPNLESLYIDLSYEDCSSYRDRNPLYDELLPTGSPTWPSELNSIIVGPLRSLNLSDAEDFYSSLINAAEHLPYLRIIKIKTLLNNASWRDRAELRARWRPLFERVFAANKTYSPSPPKLVQDTPMSSQRKSKRLQELDDASASEDIDIVDELPAGIPKLPRQNLCEVVEFEISDQRPAPEQWREADFLDSEVSGDEEWNGRDDAIPLPRYAW